jgi:hypothetical protein
MDAGGAADESAFLADGEVVWSWRLNGWRQVGERNFTGDGDNKA